MFILSPRCLITLRGAARVYAWRLWTPPYDPRRVCSIYLPCWLFRSHLLFFGTTRHTVLRRISACRCFSVSCRFSGTYLPGVLGTCLTSWTCSGTVALDRFLLYELTCLFSPYLSPLLSEHSVGTYAAPVMGLCSFLLLFLSACFLA